MRKLYLAFIKFLSHSWCVLGQAIALIAVAEVIVFVIASLGMLDNKPVEPFSLLDKDAPIPESYINSDWYGQYVQEFTQMIDQVDWCPYVYWKTKPFVGKYINVNEDSSRRTWTPPPSDNRFRIFMFGGSTLWGWGARDDFTIPSFVAKILYEDYGLNADVINLSEIGYVNTQEVICLIRELQRQNLPHLAIFYDGLNDVCSTLRPGHVGTAGVPWDEIERKIAFEKEKRSILSKISTSYVAHSSLCFILNKVLHKASKTELSQQLSPSQLNQLSDDIVGVYRENTKIVKSFVEAYNFKVLFYWQPVILTKNDLTIYEQRLNEDGEAYLHAAPLQSLVQQKLSTLNNELFHDISDVLSGHQRAFYIDYFHIDEKGNEIIARRIVQDVLKSLGKIPNNADSSV